MAEAPGPAAGVGYEEEDEDEDEDRLFVLRVVPAETENKRENHHAIADVKGHMISMTSWPELYLTERRRCEI